MILMLFWKTLNFWRENGRGRHAGAKGSRVSRPDQKVGSLGGTFVQPFSRINGFENLWPKPPLLILYRFTSTTLCSPDFPISRALSTVVVMPVAFLLLVYPLNYSSTATDDPEFFCTYRGRTMSAICQYYVGLKYRQNMTVKNRSWQNMTGNGGIWQEATGGDRMRQEVTGDGRRWQMDNLADMDTTLKETVTLGLQTV